MIRKRTTSRTSGFTLTELMVVIAIILLITFMALPAVLATLKDRKLSDATRAIQAALAGARDRAIESGQVSGVRLVRDTTSDPWDCTTLLYVGTPEPYAVGLVTLSDGPDNVNNATGSAPGDGIPDYTKVKPSGTPDPHFEYVDSGRDGKVGGAFDLDNIPRVELNRSLIRFDSTGPYYRVTALDSAVTPATLGILPLAPANLKTGEHSYQLYGPPVPLARDRDAAINLADGIVIDLRFASIAAQFGTTHPLANNPQFDVPRSRGLPNQVPREAFLKGNDNTYGTSDDPPPATWPFIEILFGPDGNVVGPGAATPLMHLWLGERADKLAVRPHRLITLNTRTSGVSYYDEPDTSTVGAPNYPLIYGPPEDLLGRSRLEALGCTY